MSLLLLLRTLFTPAPVIPPGERSFVIHPARRTAVVAAGRGVDIRSMHRGARIVPGRSARVEIHHRTVRPA